MLIVLSINVFADKSGKWKVFAAALCGYWCPAGASSFAFMRFSGGSFAGKSGCLCVAYHSNAGKEIAEFTA